MEGFRLLAAIIDRAWFCVRRALGQAPGHVVSKFDEDGNLWIGFQCARTGEVRHAFIDEDYAAARANEWLKGVDNRNLSR